MERTEVAKFNLVQRAKAILLSPSDEWKIIAAEPASISALYRDYAAILAAIPAVAQFLRGTLFGYGVSTFRHKPGILSALTAAIAQYVIALLALAVLAVIANYVVTKFDGKADRLSAFKLATFALTASWLAGAFELIPGLGWLSILGVYSFYLLYTGLPELMQVPKDKALVCALAIGVAAVVTMVVASLLVSPISTLTGGGPVIAGKSDVLGNIGGTNGSSASELEQRFKRMEQNVKQAADRPIEADTLKAFLPERLGPYERTSVGSTTMGVAGAARGSSIKADYRWGERTLKVELVDMAAMGAMAGIGSALGIQSETETEDGFSRVRSMEDRMVMEKWSESRSNGSYAVTFADRFTLTVEGDADSFGTIESAAGEIDIDRIAALAK